MNNLELIEINKKNRTNSITTRFMDAKWCIPDLPVTIVGLGGTGSWLSNFLGKQEAELHLYEKDVVAVENLGTQHYDKVWVGTSKLEATNAQLSNYGNCTVIPYEKWFVQGDYLTPLVISCVDSFKARKEIFLTWLDFYNLSLIHISEPTRPY